jgi:hypothetical protein
VLKASGKEDARFPHPFELRVKVTLEDEAFTQELTATNTGAEGGLQQRRQPGARCGAGAGALT